MDLLKYNMGRYIKCKSMPYTPIKHRATAEYGVKMRIYNESYSNCLTLLSS